jgi:hypothetical protein
MQKNVTGVLLGKSSFHQVLDLRTEPPKWYWRILRQPIEKSNCFACVTQTFAKLNSGLKPET